MDESLLFFIKKEIALEINETFDTRISEFQSAHPYLNNE